MSRRRLRAEERELWNQVARSAIPLHPPSKKEVTPAQVSSPKPEKPQPEPEPVLPFRVGSKAKSETALPQTTSSPHPRMDAKAFRKLTKGKLAPEGRLDLHGMRVEEAHAQLTTFILRSHAKGRRLVLVITGKGEREGKSAPFPYQRGILRRQVPHWLRQAPLSPLILDVTQASLRHGGEGALYVYLARHR
ncbi:MAG: Smr/MutS family protein [Pseudomonadota bacterium]